MSRFFDSQNKAFGVFFDERAVIECRRTGITVRGTYDVCVFPGVAADPMSDSSLETDVKRATVILSRHGLFGWVNSVGPRIGDTITRENGDTYAITKVDTGLPNAFTLEGKLVK